MAPLVFCARHLEPRAGQPAHPEPRTTSAAGVWRPGNCSPTEGLGALRCPPCQGVRVIYGQMQSKGAEENTASSSPPRQLLCDPVGPLRSAFRLGPAPQLQSTGSPEGPSQELHVEHPAEVAQARSYPTCPDPTLLHLYPAPLLPPLKPHGRPWGLEHSCLKVFLDTLSGQHPSPAPILTSFPYWLPFVLNSAHVWAQLTWQWDLRAQSQGGIFLEEELVSTRCREVGSTPVSGTGRRLVQRQT